MKQLLVLLSAIMISFSVHAAVNTGENLIANGSFVAEQDAFPEFWSADSAERAQVLSSGGPNGTQSAVVLREGVNDAVSVTVCQQALALVAGDTYKLSAIIKTSGFTSRRGGLVVHNANWAQDEGFENLPINSEWTYFEKTFTLFPSQNNLYSIVFFAHDLSGEIAFADVRLEAVDKNLILNGSFDTEHDGIPDSWSLHTPELIRYLPTGGPNGSKPSFALSGDGSVSSFTGLRQLGLELVAGETYKLSAYIKTSGFTSSQRGLVVHNASWIQDVGFKILPVNSDWTYFEKTFTLFPSQNNLYGVAFYAKNLSGEIAIADVKLETVAKNLVTNGSFDAEQGDFPESWVPSSSERAQVLPTGGPGGDKPALVLRKSATDAVSVTMHQQGLGLVAGKTYKLSATIKTSGFTSSHGGLVVHNANWAQDEGFKNLPVDSDWTYFEKIFTMFPSQNNLYNIAFFAHDLSGEIAIADVKLEAIDTNLIINGSFDAEQADIPIFWDLRSAELISCLPTGGPDGNKPAVVLRGSASGPSFPTFRQQGLALVAGEPYKLSAYFKTSGFTSSLGGLVVHNYGWLKDEGFKNLPVDSEWTYFEKTFTMFSSQNNLYGIAFFARDLSGEIAIADVKLEALSEKAIQGSSSKGVPRTAPCLVPLTPLLNKIPITHPELTFQVYGDLPQTQVAYECLVTIGGNPIPEQTVPLQSDKILVNFSGLTCGNYTLEATLRHRETRKPVLRVARPIRIVNFPEIDHSAIKPLNNLVAELLNTSITSASGDQTFTFDTPRDGWVFMALASLSPAASDLEVTLDGQDSVITATTDRLEAFREVGMGTHRITISGGSPDMRLHVRSIPEIFNYPPCSNPFVAENGLYDWAFMKKYILYAVTTLNGGSLPGTALPEAKARGLRWLANFLVRPLDDPADIQGRMENTLGMIQPQYDGFTCDEFSFNDPAITNYTHALWELRNPEQRLVYTWVVDKPSVPSRNTDFISASLNTSNGRGRLLFEAYCLSQADEKTADAYLDDMVDETMRRFQSFFPNVAAGTGIIFGNFNQIPIISLEHYPDVDYKYFLDMQVNRVANHPEFKDLATVGYWGTYYGDEELARWSFRLMRHYAVEGRKDMLSDRYGFTYMPGFLNNGDFVEDLNGWNLTPAAEGSIRKETLTSYGAKAQGRWHGGSIGDTVCVMTRQATATNRISQTASGLTIGKAYCLQFVTADRNDVLMKKYNPRRYGIEVELGGIEPIADKSFVYIDRRKLGSAPRAGELVGKINLHRIVFRATSSEQTVVFNDANALPGESLCINFIQFKPYFESGVPAVAGNTFDFVIETTAANETFAFIVDGALDFVINWGDGVSETENLNGLKSHTFATAGLYTNRVSGTATRIAFGEKVTAPTLSGTTPQLLTDIVSRLSDGVTGITSAQEMFWGATQITQFTQADWFDVASANVTSMNHMFFGATAFKQDISRWNVSGVKDFTNFLYGNNLPTDVYNQMLIRWSRLPLQPSVRFDGGGSTYDNGLPAECRQRIIDTFMWTINDGNSTGNPYRYPPTVFDLK